MGKVDILAAQRIARKRYLDALERNVGDKARDAFRQPPFYGTGQQKEQKMEDDGNGKE